MSEQVSTSSSPPRSASSPPRVLVVQRVPTPMPPSPILAPRRGLLDADGWACPLTRQEGDPRVGTCTVSTMSSGLRNFCMVSPIENDYDDDDDDDSEDDEPWMTPAMKVKESNRCRDYLRDEIKKFRTSQALKKKGKKREEKEAEEAEQNDNNAEPTEYLGRLVNNFFELPSPMIDFFLYEKGDSEEEGVTNEDGTRKERWGNLPTNQYQRAIKEHKRKRESFSASWLNETSFLAEVNSVDEQLETVSMDVEERLTKYCDYDNPFTTGVPLWLSLREQALRTIQVGYKTYRASRQLEQAYNDQAIQNMWDGQYVANMVRDFDSLDDLHQRQLKKIRMDRLKTEEQFWTRIHELEMQVEKEAGEEEGHVSTAMTLEEEKAPSSSSGLVIRRSIRLKKMEEEDGKKKKKKKKSSSSITTPGRLCCHDD